MKSYKGITPRGDSIQVSFTWNGERYRETLKWRPTSPNMQEASRLRESVLLNIGRGLFDHNSYLAHFPCSAKAKSLSSTKADFLSIDNALWNWLRSLREHLEKSTQRDYTSAISHHLSPRFGSMVVSELKAADVKTWLNELDISNKRKNNILTPLRQCFRELFLDEVIDINPMERVRNLSVSTREPEPFSQDDIQLILRQLNDSDRLPYKNLIQFAFATGLRTSELIALRWSDVDLDNSRIQVKRARVRGTDKTPKTSSGRRFVDLQPAALEAINKQFNYQIKHIKEVFYDVSQEKPFKDDQYIRKGIWKPALKRAGIKYRSPYQTRHTYASHLLSQGKNPLYVANQMGHADWGMIRKVYGKWIKQEKSNDI
ncbi:MAG: tyrosine-type recombinase/integrase [Bermanella sp.]